MFRVGTVVSAMVLAAASGNAFAGGHTSVSFGAGDRGGAARFSYSSFDSHGRGGDHGFRRDFDRHDRFDSHGGWRWSFYVNPVIRVGYPYGYCAPEPVYYQRPIVIERPVVYSQPVAYVAAPTYPVVQTVNTLPVVTEPVLTQRVVVQDQTTNVVQVAAPTVNRTTTIETTAQRVLTPYEAGLRAIRDRKPGEAIDQLNEHLRLSPDDTRTLRLTALLYAEQNNCAEAVSRMIDSYKANPNLVNQPIDTSELGIGAGRMRDITNNMERYAMKFKTGSSYLATSVLMQAEGRQADALATAQKASAAGLDQAIGAGLEAALK